MNNKTIGDAHIYTGYFKIIIKNRVQFTSATISAYGKTELNRIGKEIHECLNTETTLVFHEVITSDGIKYCTEGFQL